MFIRNCWYVAAWSTEVPAEGVRAMTLINEPLVLFRTSDGEVVALEDRCCHRQAPLSLGRREGDAIRCGYHGLKFDRAGRCIEIPGQQSIPPRARVRRYPAVDRHGWVWVWMGEEALGDSALIPEAVALDDAEWALRSGSMDCRASHLLIHDNLCDFSHIAFVHETSFGAGGYKERVAEVKPRITSLARGIRVETWVPAHGPGLDHWTQYDYLVPGVLLLRTEHHVAGTAARCGQEPPTTEPIMAARTSQAVTAMTDDTSRYFYSWGPRACEVERFPNLPDIMLAVANRAFEEDRQMLEAQQRNCERRPAHDTISIVHDRGPLLMRSVFERLAKQEANAWQERETA